MSFGAPDHRGHFCIRADDIKVAEQGFDPSDLGLPDAGTIEPRKTEWSQTQYHWSEAIPMVLPIVLAFGIVIVGALFFPNASGQLGTWAYSIAVGLAVVITAGLRPMLKRKWHKDVASQYENSLLLHWRCPSCVADLSETGSEPDGCTVCPECDAAWRLPVVEPAD